MPRSPVRRSETPSAELFVCCPLYCFRDGLCRVKVLILHASANVLVSIYFLLASEHFQRQSLFARAELHTVFSFPSFTRFVYSATKRYGKMQKRGIQEVRETLILLFFSSKVLVCFGFFPIFAVD